MADGSTRQAHLWLIKAEHDLASARRLGSGDDPILDTAVFHCQQAGEKALKALLVWHEAKLRRTHDLRLLLHALADHLPETETLREFAELLTPYAAAYRYPGELVQLGLGEFAEALAAAERILAVAKQHLPPAE